MSEPKYRSVLHQTVNLGFGAWLVNTAGADNRIVVNAQQKRFLELCRQRNSLEGHAHGIRKILRAGEDKMAEIRAALGELAQEGLLTSDFRVRSVTYGTPPPITTVAFPTADRVAPFREALESYAANFRDNGRSPSLLVADDSRGLSVQHEYRTITRQCCADQNIRYIGRHERRLYAASLAKKGIDPLVSQFAILGEFGGQALRTLGANRNSILLDTAGEHVFLVDDDTLCRCVMHPDSRAELALASHEYPRDAFFFSDRRALLQAMEWRTCDLLGLHERMLGRDIADLVAERPVHCADLDQACNHLLWSIEEGGGTVDVTLGGLAGDAGAATAIRFLTAPRIVKRLLESESLFRTAFDSREVLEVVPVETVTHFAMCQATTAGLANRRTLPPFLPIGRNSDGVFGVLLALTGRNSFFGHVPVAIFHNAETGRTYDALPPFRCAELVISLAAHVTSFRGAGAEASLRMLGSQFQEVANLRDAEFWHVLFEAVSAGAATHVRSIESVFRTLGDPPQYWKDKVIEVHREMARQILRNDCIPAELRREASADEARQLTREFVRLFGVFLAAWPDMLAAARELKNEGMRLSVPIGRMS
jgi:hypothetical protein